jgi:hypothetical protein
VEKVEKIDLIERLTLLLVFYGFAFCSILVINR